MYRCDPIGRDSQVAVRWSDHQRITTNRLHSYFVIHLSHVSKFYKASTRPALDDVTIDVDKGEFAFVIGPSGSGKSTFLRLLIREDVPTSGSVEVDGQDLVHLRRSKVAA